MSEDGKSGGSTAAHDGVRGPRSISIVIVLLICCAIAFSGFVGLGTWQLKRLAWKRDLISRVEQRVHAPPSAIPAKEQWPAINAQSDEYRRVRIICTFQQESSARSQASTILGRGFWLMTPCQMADGNAIWVNRGFIEFNSSPIRSASSDATSNSGLQSSPDTIPAEAQVVTGLLRISEPKGSLMQANRPELQQWFSRDIEALTRSHPLLKAENTAPFFIDAEATETPSKCANGACSDYPIGGLTVIHFNNNHLVYSITWYGLAIMVALAGYVLIRSERRLRSNAN